MGVWLLFAALLILMTVHSGATQKWAAEARDMREEQRRSKEVLQRMEKQLVKLAIAMDATNETLGPVIQEAVENAVIAANDEEAEAAEKAVMVPDTRAYTVKDEAA